MENNIEGFWRKKIAHCEYRALEVSDTELESTKEINVLSEWRPHPQAIRQMDSHRSCSESESEPESYICSFKVNEAGFIKKM